MNPRERVSARREADGTIVVRAEWVPAGYGRELVASTHMMDAAARRRDPSARFTGRMFESGRTRVRVYRRPS